MSIIIDKLVNLAILGGLGILAYEAYKCKQTDSDLIGCIFGNLSLEGGKIASSMAENSVSNSVNFFQSFISGTIKTGENIGGEITCALMGKKLEDDLITSLKGLIKGDKPKLASC